MNAFWQINEESKTASRLYWENGGSLLAVIKRKTIDQDIVYLVGWLPRGENILTDYNSLKYLSEHGISAFVSKRPYALGNELDPSTDACIFALAESAFMHLNAKFHSSAMKERFLRERHTVKHLIAFAEVGHWEGVSIPEIWTDEALMLLEHALIYHDWHKLAAEIRKLAFRALSAKTKKHEFSSDS